MYILGSESLHGRDSRFKNLVIITEYKIPHTWAFCYLWAVFGHLAVESVGTSVWWSDFSILQAFCNETQPDNLLAKCLEHFHEAPAVGVNDSTTVSSA